MKPVLLHVGCANRYYDGFINSDMCTGWKDKEYKLDLVMNMAEPWPYENESVDGIVGMAVFQQLVWRDLVVAFQESFRVLKPGGVMRLGVPMIENGKPLDHLLGWNNINLFNYPLLKTVLVEHIGYTSIKLCKYRETSVPEFAQIDNREDHQFYIEVTK